MVYLFQRGEEKVEYIDIYIELKINNIFSGCHQIKNIKKKIMHPTQNLTNLFHGEFSQNYELEF